MIFKYDEVFLGWISPLRSKWHGGMGFALRSKWQCLRYFFMLR